jgi:hypothetical protein
MILLVAKRINIYSRQEAESKLAGLFRRRWADLYLDPLYQDTITGDPDRLGKGWPLPGSSLPGYHHRRSRQVRAGLAFTWILSTRIPSQEIQTG